MLSTHIYSCIMVCELRTWTYTYTHRQYTSDIKDIMIQGSTDMLPSLWYTLFTVTYMQQIWPDLAKCFPNYLFVYVRISIGANEPGVWYIGFADTYIAILHVGLVNARCVCTTREGRTWGRDPDLNCNGRVFLHKGLEILKQVIMAWDNSIITQSRSRSGIIYLNTSLRKIPALPPSGAQTGECRSCFFLNLKEIYRRSWLYARLHPSISACDSLIIIPDCLTRRILFDKSFYLEL
jgi:hypothetical protein